VCSAASGLRSSQQLRPGWAVPVQVLTVSQSTLSSAPLTAGNTSSHSVFCQFSLCHWRNAWRPSSFELGSLSLWARLSTTVRRCRPAQPVGRPWSRVRANRDLLDAIKFWSSVAGVPSDNAGHSLWGFPFHAACWDILVEACSPDDLDIQVLFDLCRSFPLQLGILNWGHDYGGVVRYETTSPGLGAGEELQFMCPSGLASTVTIL
jgi:hypothetical protein